MDSNRENKNVNTRVVPARYICQELDCATPRILTKQKSQEQLTTCLELLLTPPKKMSSQVDTNYETKTQHRDITINHSETIQHIFEGKKGGTLGDTLRTSHPVEIHIETP